jgi:hypothetical protein
MGKNSGREEMLRIKRITKLDETTVNITIEGYPESTDENITVKDLFELYNKEQNEEWLAQDKLFQEKMEENDQ